jgi:tight adherence protein B
MKLYLAILAAVSVGEMFVVYLWRRMKRDEDLKRMKARLRGGAEKAKGAKSGGAALIQPEDQTAGQIVLRLMHRIRLNERARMLLEQAGLKWQVGRSAHGVLALALAGFAAVWYTAPPYRSFAPVAALALGSLPVLYILRLRKRRIGKFEEQFPDSLEFLSRAMRAGHAFSVSLEMIHHEFQEPLAGEFRRVFDEQNLGMPLEAALLKMGQRIPIIDVQFFVSAVILQKRTGGNLAEVLDKLAGIIRERFKLRGRIKAISAHGKMTSTTLSMIPVFVGLMMLWVNPGYAHFFVDDPMGRTMFWSAVGLQLVGYGVMKKIVAIEI